MHEFKYPMGATLKDVISGFKGVVVYRVQHITGCDNYGLMPKGLDKDGNPKETKQFDENRLKPVGEEIVSLLPKKEEKAILPPPKGGPQPFVGRKS